MLVGIRGVLIILDRVQTTDEDNLTQCCELERVRELDKAVEQVVVQRCAMQGVEGHFVVAAAPNRCLGLQDYFPPALPAGSVSVATARRPGHKVKH